MYGGTVSGSAQSLLVPPDGYDDCGVSGTVEQSVVLSCLIFTYFLALVTTAFLIYGGPASGSLQPLLVLSDHCDVLSSPFLYFLTTMTFVVFHVWQTS